MKPGEVYRVFVPYQDKQGGKYRPALIMNTSQGKAIVVAIKITKTPPTSRFPIESISEIGEVFRCTTPHMHSTIFSLY